MLDSTVFQALMAGLISAFSMPLGAVTALMWKPSQKMLACLISFGAGALLSALVIDLVGNAREKGHILELIVGSILGSFFFSIVNKLVNSKGGFLRKPSTVLLHLNQKQENRFKASFSQLKLSDLFRHLPSQDIDFITTHLLIKEYPPNSTIYKQGDGGESFYLIEEGEVQLLDPLNDLKPYQTFHKNETFGYLAFLTGSCHQVMAVTTKETRLGIFPRPDFEELLQTSPVLAEATMNFIQTEQIAKYLQYRHGWNLEQVKDWVTKAFNSIKFQRLIPDAIPVDRNLTDFLMIARQIKRFPLFKNLPLDELKEIGNCLLYQHFDDGFVFFQAGEFADRLFFINEGEVELIEPKSINKPQVLKNLDAFGGFATITRSNHSVMAIAKTDVTAWVLREKDLWEISQQSNGFKIALTQFLQEKRVQTYLAEKQHLEPQKAVDWSIKAFQNMNNGQLIPAVTEMVKKEHSDAPIAIWIGLLMDGIPEALTIGAHIVSQPISISLLTGLFISNYPEALSSSNGMKQQGFSNAKILIMWSSIMLITGILASLGSILFADAPESLVSFLGSMAAGAMLTVISETMLPEAYAKGGSVVGMSTLFGFLVIIVINSVG